MLACVLAWGRIDWIIFSHWHQNKTETTPSLDSRNKQDQLQIQGQCDSFDSHPCNPPNANTPTADV